MTIHYQGHGVTLHHGDCLDVLRALPDASVDSVCTDPPYGLEFMGKEWDKFAAPSKGRADLVEHSNFTAKKSKFKDGVGTQVGMPKKNPRCRACSRLKFDKPASKCACGAPDWDTRTREYAQDFQQWCEAWAAECLRVLKPGGHLLAFGGTRTWHRLACAVEDAGFEVRDSIAWMYGSGFPKSLDVSKAIDKMDATHERRARALRFTAWMRSTGITARQVDEATGTNMGGHYLTAESQPAVATVAHLDMLRPLLPEVPEWVEEMARQRTVESLNYAARPITQAEVRPLASGEHITFDQRGSKERERRDIPTTPDAERWQGWGTALKPSFEGVVCAVKPVPPLARIGSRLDELEQSCRPPASSAAPSSAPTPHDSPEARTATAPASAATQPGDEPARLTPTGAAAGSSAATATSASESTVGTFSSTVTSWKACWAELCEATSTSTTATRSSTTTDLETLWSCLSQITPESTMTDPTNPDGLSSLVGAVDAMFAAAVLNSRATRTLTAIESATSGTPLTSPAAEGSRPAFEPVVVARKPLIGTVAANVQQWGTGALNIGACRIEGAKPDTTRGGHPEKHRVSDSHADAKNLGRLKPQGRILDDGKGRWPANVVLDEEMARRLDEQSGEAGGGTGRSTRGGGNGGDWNPTDRTEGAGQTVRGDGREVGYGDMGGASRFFFVASHDKGDTSALTGKGGRIESCETASTAAESSSPPRQFGDSALGGAVTSEHPDTASQTGSPSTSATPSGSRPSGRPATPTTQNIDAESSPEQQPGERTPTASPASSVGPSAPTVTTTTTTSPSTSAGSAAPATSDTTSQWKALGDTDSAPFKYVAKADATERPRVNGTAHPTVKPLALMRWLVRLVTPPGGTVLEPFAGSGTTVEACIIEGFDCIAIEKTDEYLPLIMQRIHRRRDPVAAIRQTGDELGLFELDGEGA